MIILIVIYLLSVVGMWCWYHFMMEYADGESLFLTLCPGANTFMNIIWIIVLFVEASEWLQDNTNYQKYIDKFFGL